ncbi:MAG TPA: TonB family protein [Lacunisphaera sp.]|nr:TonB family protein [Lacunisphaera sp.]
MKTPLIYLWCLGMNLAVIQAPAAETRLPDDIVHLEQLEIRDGPTAEPHAVRGAPAIEPLRIKPTTELGFPQALTNTLVREGWARVMIAVDAEGRLEDLMVVSYTHESFGREAARALREWQYRPARQSGQPVGSRLTLLVDFSDNRAGIKMWQMGDIDQAPGFNWERVLKEIYEPRELDSPVRAREVVRPANPIKAIPSAGDRNIVKIDFVIDATGKPRMPVVVSSPHDAFAQAAIDALIQWRFTPPQRWGKAVAVQLQKEFVFIQEKRE